MLFRSEQLQPQGEGEDPQDLDDAFERELCELWDMSMNAVSSQEILLIDLNLLS